MRPEIKAIDVKGLSLLEWSPKEEDFRFQVTLAIGPEDTTAQEYFYCDVCSLDWLRSELNKNYAIVLQKMIVLTDYDPAQIESILQSKVRAISGPNWSEVVAKLVRFLDWEFEGY